jgi:chromosome segregation ATPase
VEACTEGAGRGREVSEELERERDDLETQRDALARENAELRAKVEELGAALKTAINTVECASIDLKTGEELPWYKAAKAALKGQP